MVNEINPVSFLKGGGEMGELTRSKDWTLTSLGAISSWPPTLRTTVSIILNSRFPMFLWWGSELIQFYNDAYRPSLGVDGKHPEALGQRGVECCLLEKTNILNRMCVFNKHMLPEGTHHATLGTTCRAATEYQLIKDRLIVSS